MKVLLINPKRVGRGQASVRYMNATPLALPLLASLTPPDVEVRIIDENIQDVNFDEPADLVGITVMHHVGPRAFEISREFHKRGVPVVLGGFYPSLYPDEAVQKVDSIVIGEAERVWPRLLRDVQKNNLQRTYRESSFIDMAEVPFIRKEHIVDAESYHVETTRGCPYDCDFCSVTRFYGRGFRSRPVDHVVRQLEEFKGHQIFFVDDNLAGNRKYSKELFRALRGGEVSWSGQTSLNVAEDDEWLDLAVQSGCKFLFVGMESLNVEALKSVNKGWAQPHRYGEWIQKIHDRGMGVYSSFIFGFEEDHKDVFEKTIEFCEKNKVDLALFGVICPFHGSNFHKQLVAENRYFGTDPSKFNGQYVVFQPKNMTVDRLEEGLRWTWKTFYSKASINRRLGHYWARLGERALRFENYAAGRYQTGDIMLYLNTAFRIAVEDF